MENFFGDKLNINKTEENTNPREIKPLRIIKAVDIQPIDKQSTDQPTPSVPSDGTNKIQSLKDTLTNMATDKTPSFMKGLIDKVSTYKERFMSADNREKMKEEYYQACIVLNACRGLYKDLGNPEKAESLTPEQQEFIKVLEEARKYNNKAKKYKDQLLIDQDTKSFIKDLENVNQDLKKNKLAQEAVFSASIKTDSSGKITIDLAKFVPSAIDLSKLDLSDQNHIEIDLSHINKTKYNYPLSNVHSLSLDNRTLNSALKLGYLSKLYNTHPDLYRQTLEHSLKTQLYLKLGKTDLPTDAFNKFTELSSHYAEKLTSIVISGKPELDESIRNDHHYSSNDKSEIRKDYQDDIETQRKKNELKALFSDDSAERNVAEGKYIEDPEKYFKQEATIAKELFEWAETFTKRFNLHEGWVQAGMKQQLGIEPNNFHDVHQQLNNLVDNLKSDDNTIVLPDDQTYKELVVANAKLKTIRQLLNDGIPVEDTPTQINGLERVTTSGNAMNCLIHALLKVDKPERDMHEIVQEAPSIRENLAKKMEKKLDEYTRDQKRAADEGVDTLIFSEGYNAVKSNHMLSLGAFDGKELINYLREHNLIDPDRSLLIYELDKKRKIRCNEHYPIHSSEKKPYSLFLYQDYHFEAMIEPQKKEGERPN